MKPRKKASDIFRETDYAFVKKVLSLRRFRSLRISESRCGNQATKSGAARRGRVYTKANPPGEFVDCSNSVCHGGGVSIGEILRSMIDQGKTEEHVSRGCRGYEGSPKGRRKYRSCMHSFDVKVALKYRVKAGAA